MGKILEEMGEDCSDQRLESMVAEIDTDKSGTVEFGEFLTMIDQVHSQSDSDKHASFAAAMKRSGRGSIFQIKTKGGGTHTFSEDEKAAFSEHINKNFFSDKKEKAAEKFTRQGANQAAFYKTCKLYVDLEQTEAGQNDPRIKFFEECMKDN